MVKSLLAAIVLLSGCASFRPVAYEYKSLNLTLVCADEYTIDRICRGGGNLHTDKGAPYPSSYDWRDKDGMLHFETVLVPACFRAEGREIWMKWGGWCDTMAHELCHADGQPAAFCEDNYPRRKS